MRGETILRAQGLRDRLGDEGGVAQCGKADPEDTRLVLGDEGGGRLEREPGLARAARPGQGEEPRAALDPLDDLRELCVATDEGARRTGQVRVRDRLERGKGLASELVDGDRFDDVLEAVLAEVCELEPFDQVARRCAQHDLPAVPRRGDARGEVHLLADVALVAEPRLARVQADPYLDRARGERARHLGSGGERARCRREGEEKGVSLCVDLDTAMRRAGLADHTTMLREHLVVDLVPEFLKELRRALHVGEEEGDGAAGEIVSHAP